MISWRHELLKTLYRLPPLQTVVDSNSSLHYLSLGLDSKGGSLLPLLSGCGATVAHQLPKLRVAGSNPVARSNQPGTSSFPRSYTSNDRSRLVSCGKLWHSFSATYLIGRRHLFNIAEAHGEAEVQPNGMTDGLGTEAMAMVRRDGAAQVRISELCRKKLRFKLRLLT